MPNQWSIPEHFDVSGWYPGYQFGSAGLAPWHDAPGIFGDADFRNPWILNFHYPSGMTPMGTLAAAECWSFGSQLAAERLSHPGSGGIRYRWLGPYPYLSQVPPPGDVEERKVKFIKNTAPYLRDFHGVWEERKRELLRGFSALKNALLTAATPEPDTLRQARRYQQHAWEIHFELMYVCLVPYLSLYHLCEQMGLPTAEVPVLLQGYETRLMATDRAMGRLAIRLGELGLEPLNHEETGANWADALTGSRLGLQWLAEFQEFLDEYGWRIDEGADPAYPTWHEEPAVPLDRIRRYYTLLRQGHDPFAHLTEAAIKRSQAEAELLSRLSSQVQRQQFLTALEHCRSVNFVWWNEEHAAYIDLLASVPLRLGLTRIGERWVSDGVLQQTADIFYLFYEEVEEGLGQPDRRGRFAGLVSERKHYYRRWLQRKAEMPPILGTLADAVHDPILLEVHGLHAHYLQGLSRQGGVSALSGVPASAGVGQGRARIVRSTQDLGAVEPGEVLVCESTLPSWTGVFPYVSACVCDRGGMLTHAAIVSREFGIPCVVGIGNVTAAVHNGDWLEVDGTRGVVTIYR